MVNLSLAELVGIVPFAGGSFGFVRCSLGPFWGFFTASAEMFLYQLFSVRTVQKLAQLVTVAAETNQSMERVWALCAYVVLTGLHLRGGNLFWGTMMACTIFTFAVLGVYMIASLTVADFHQYATVSGRSDGFDDSEGRTYMLYCYFPMWFYIGICALPLTGQRVKDAHVNIPHAIIAGLSTLASITIVVIFCVACQKPGIGPKLSKLKYVLQTGFENVFDMNVKKIAVLLFIPTFASAVGFMFASKHQFAAMADSGLMPAIFKQRFGPNKTPAYSILFCTILQLSVYLVIDHYLLNLPRVTFRLCSITACLVYALVLLAFISFRYKFAHMKRHFVNPFGIPGAVIGILIFGQIFSAAIYCDGGNRAGPIALLVFLALMCIYYFAYAQHVQFFSKEEQDKFMKAYIVNANTKRYVSRWTRMCNALLTAVGLESFIAKGSLNRSRNTAISMVSRTSNTGSVDRPSIGSASSAVSTPTNHRQGSTNPAPFSLRHNRVDIDNHSAKSTSSAKSGKLGGSVKRAAGVRPPSLTWSGKRFADDRESRKAFQLLHHQSEDVFEEMDEAEDNVHYPSAKTHVQVADTEEGGEEVSGPIVADLLAAHFPEHFVEESKDDEGAVGGTLEVDVEGGGAAHTMVRAAESATS